MRLFPIAVCVALASASAIAASVSGVEYLCQPRQPILRPGTTEHVGPIYLLRNAQTSQVERMDVSLAHVDSQRRGHKYNVRRFPVPAEPYQKRCAQGHSVTAQSGVVNRYDPNFRSGGSGAAFLVATFGSYPGEYWALYFQNVSSWTQ